MVTEKLIEAITTFMESHAIKSKNVYLLDHIDAKQLVLHQKRYEIQIGPDERPLLAVARKSLGIFGGYGWSGFLLTNKKLYYKCLKDTFWVSLVALSDKGEIPLDQIRMICIGNHDHCYGTAYIGHQLVVNGTVLGLVRMGGGLEYDEKAIDELNKIFQMAL